MKSRLIFDVTNRRVVPDGLFGRCTERNGELQRSRWGAHGEQLGLSQKAIACEDGF